MLTAAVSGLSRQVTMVLYIYLFDSKVLGQMDMTLQWMMYPMTWALQRLLSSFKSTTRERSQRAEDPCYERYVILTFMVPVLLVAVCFTAPVALLAFLCWAPIQRSRRPFRYSCQNTSKEIQLWKERESRERHLRVSCINTCLYDEFPSRQRNLGMTPPQRAAQIARLINESQNPPPAIPSAHRQMSFSIKMQEGEESILMSPRTTPSVFSPLSYTSLDNRYYYIIFRNAQSINDYNNVTRMSCNLGFLTTGTTWISRISFTRWRRSFSPRLTSCVCRECSTLRHS